MDRVQVDLNIRILPANHNVYVSRPGKSCRLYSEVVKQSAILVELPGLDLEQGVPVEQQKELLAQFKRAKDLRTWHRLGRPQDAMPERELEVGYAKKGNSLGQLIGLVRNIFESLKKGDLVVVPPGPMAQEAMIGEVVDEPMTYEKFEAPNFFQKDLVLGRRVKWLGSITKRRLPNAILDALEKPSAFFLVERSLRSRFYDVAYQAYCIDDLSVARFDVTSPDYSIDDDASLLAFFKLVSANVRHALAADEKAIKDIGSASLIRLKEYAPDVRTNINSPGFLSLSSKFITPLVISALLALAVQVGSQAADLADQGMIDFTNSAGPVDHDCTARVFAETVRQLKFYGLEKWPEACVQAQKAADGTGLKIPSKAAEAKK